MLPSLRDKTEQQGSWLLLLLLLSTSQLAPNVICGFLGGPEGFDPKFKDSPHVQSGCIRRWPSPLRRRRSSPGSGRPRRTRTRGRRRSGAAPRQQRSSTLQNQEIMILKFLKWFNEEMVEKQIGRIRTKKFFNHSKEFLIFRTSINFGRAKLSGNAHNRSVFVGLNCQIWIRFIGILSGKLKVQKNAELLVFRTLVGALNFGNNYTILTSNLDEACGRDCGRPCFT